MEERPPSPTYASAFAWLVIGTVAFLICEALGAPVEVRVAFLTFAVLLAGYSIGRRHAELLYMQAVATIEADASEQTVRQAWAQVVEHDQLSKRASITTSIHDAGDGEGYEWHTTVLVDGDAQASRVAYDQTDALRNHKALAAKFG